MKNLQSCIFIGKFKVYLEINEGLKQINPSNKAVSKT